MLSGVRALLKGCEKKFRTHQKFHREEYPSLSEVRTFSENPEYAPAFV